MGGLYAADLALMGPGERAFFMTKQLRLDQVFRNGAAVDRDKRPGVALGLAVQGPGHQFLARTALAPNQYRRFRGSQFAQQFAQVPDRATFP